MPPGGILKGAGQTAALVVDEDEGHFLRAEIQRQREDVGDDELTFAGAGHAGHQTVGAVEFFVEIQREQFSVCSHTHRHPVRN